MLANQTTALCSTAKKALETALATAKAACTSQGAALSDLAGDSITKACTNATSMGSFAPEDVCKNATDALATASKDVCSSLSNVSSAAALSKSSNKQLAVLTHTHELAVVGGNAVLKEARLSKLEGDDGTAAVEAAIKAAVIRWPRKSHGPTA